MLSARHHTARLGIALLFATGLTLAATVAPQRVPEGRFRVVRGVPAPWLAAGQAVDARALIGTEFVFADGRFDAPRGLGCADAKYARDARPAEGLFQGNLPAPATQAAERLGLVAQPVASVDLTCSSGVFDFHWATPDALLLALDNVIWTLDGSPGAREQPDLPMHTVQRLLEQHFAGDMGFLPELFAPKRQWTSAALDAAVDAYFARPFPRDEVPPIDGDPLTDSQEYPMFFSVRDAEPDIAGIMVPVRYDDGHVTRSVQFVLVREDGRFVVDDIRYPHGGSFRAMLATH